MCRPQSGGSSSGGGVANIKFNPTHDLCNHGSLLVNCVKRYRVHYRSTIKCLWATRLKRQQQWWHAPCRGGICWGYRGSNVAKGLYFGSAWHVVHSIYNTYKECCSRRPQWNVRCNITPILFKKVFLNEYMSRRVGGKSVPYAVCNRPTSFGKYDVANCKCPLFEWIRPELLLFYWNILLPKYSFALQYFFQLHQSVGHSRI